MGKLENDMIRWGRLLFERRLISGWGGNLSCRSGKNFLITGQHSPLPFLMSGDLVRLDPQGKPVRKEQRASSETPMHMAIYAGTDAQAIIHVHPPMVLAYSLVRQSFVPLSFEEKYTLGEVPVIAQETPTVTRPEQLVEALRYHPVAIIKGHGTVAIGKNFQEAFLVTDLLEEAVRCQFFKAAAEASGESTKASRQVAPFGGKPHALFSEEHMSALVESANRDREFREFGAAAGLTTSLTLQMEENDRAWTVRFVEGEITETSQTDNGDFLISGRAEWWNAVFTNKIDPFMATQQGKLKLRRGDLARLSRWYKPFQRAFSLWQTIPIQ